MKQSKPSSRLEFSNQYHCDVRVKSETHFPECATCIIQPLYNKTSWNGSPKGTGVSTTTGLGGQMVWFATRQIHMITHYLMLTFWSNADNNLFHFNFVAHAIAEAFENVCLVRLKEISCALCRVLSICGWCWFIGTFVYQGFRSVLLYHCTVAALQCNGTWKNSLAYRSIRNANPVFFWEDKSWTRLWEGMDPMAMVCIKSYLPDPFLSLNLPQWFHWYEVRKGTGRLVLEQTLCGAYHCCRIYSLRFPDPACSTGCTSKHINHFGHSLL